MSAVLWQRLEGGLVLLAALLVVVGQNLSGAGPSWWVCLLIFFAPDLGFLGYLAGPKTGAAVYNLLHLYGLGLLLAAVGAVGYGSALCVQVGMLWMGHVGFDRMLGYGLKQPSGFADTHLGRIGRR